MKKQRFKYVGDAAFERFLQKHDCPTPFHVVRMRFLGEIASRTTWKVTRSTRPESGSRSGDEVWTRFFRMSAQARGSMPPGGS